MTQIPLYILLLSINEKKECVVLGSVSIDISHLLVQINQNHNKYIHLTPYIYDLVGNKITTLNFFISLNCFGNIINPHLINEESAAIERERLKAFVNINESSLNKSENNEENENLLSSPPLHPVAVNEDENDIFGTDTIPINKPPYTPDHLIIKDISNNLNIDEIPTYKIQTTISESELLIPPHLPLSKDNNKKRKNEFKPADIVSNSNEDNSLFLGKCYYFRHEDEEEKKENLKNQNNNKNNNKQTKKKVVQQQQPLKNEELKPEIPTKVMNSNKNHNLSTQIFSIHTKHEGIKDPVNDYPDIDLDTEFMKSNYNTPVQQRVMKESVRNKRINNRDSKRKPLYQPKTYYKEPDLRTPPDKTHLISEKRNKNIIQSNDDRLKGDDSSSSFGSLDATEVRRTQPPKPFITSRLVTSTEGTQTTPPNTDKAVKPYVHPKDPTKSRKEQLLSIWNSDSKRK